MKKGAVAFAGITVGAVCVYPARVSDAVNTLKAAGCNIPVASGKLYSNISHEIIWCYKIHGNIQKFGLAFVSGSKVKR